MANIPVFTLLCGMQLVIGVLMVIFGVVDKVDVKGLYSSVMMPIWIAALAVAAGLSGLLLGNIYSKRGLIDPNAVSGLRSINIVCAAVSFCTFFYYGSMLASVNLLSSLQTSKEDQQKHKGIFAVIMILSVAEMFNGIWLALFNKEGMFLGSTPPIQHQQHQEQRQQVPRM